MGREVWGHSGSITCGDKSYLPHKAERANAWMLTRLAPDWHPHLLAFSWGFLNSLGCLEPVDSQYGVTSTAARGHGLLSLTFSNGRRLSPGFRCKLPVMEGTFLNQAHIPLVFQAASWTCDD